jgi:hypothetical protein
LVFEVRKEGEYLHDYHYYCSIHDHWKWTNGELPTFEELKKIKLQKIKEKDTNNFDRF